MAAAAATIIDRVRKHLPKLRVPGPNAVIFKEECIYSFDSPDCVSGLYVSLSNLHAYGRAEVSKNDDDVYLHIKRVRTKREKLTEGADEKKPRLVADLLAEDVVTTTTYSVAAAPDYDALLPCGANGQLDELPMLVNQVIERIVATDDAVRGQVYKAEAAWTEELQVSKYAMDLEQVPNGKRISPDPKQWRCEESGLSTNLWLNLSDGYIGSGRRNHDASGVVGGTGAALNHYKAMLAEGKQFPLVVKLGTITAAGADVYSYAADEDNAVLDPKLAEHLAHFGINVMQMQKTEKTVAELEVDVNLSFDWSVITEDGKLTQPLSGPGYVGLVNLGSSCYMSSLLQALFSLPLFAARFADESLLRALPADQVPRSMVLQLVKAHRALVRAHVPIPAPMLRADGTAIADADADAQSVRLHALKHAVANRHVEFSSGRQQDVQQYFDHFLEQLRRADHAAEAAGSLRFGSEPVPPLFTFQTLTRTYCEQSGRVGYTPATETTLKLHIPLECATNRAEVDAAAAAAAGAPDSAAAPKLVVPFSACVDRFLAEGEVDAYLSAATGLKGTARVTTRMRTFPEYLVVHMLRYISSPTWEELKIDALVRLPETLDLEAAGFRTTGPAADELLLPDDAVAPNPPVGAAAAAAAVPDELIVAQLVSMGFHENGCKRAALAVENASAEAAMEWVFAHMADPDFEQPIVAPPAAAPSAAATPLASADAAVDYSAQSEMLCGMGFTTKQALKALRSTGGDVERAADWLFNHPDDDGSDEPLAAAPSTSASAETFQDGRGVYELSSVISHIGKNTSGGHYVCHVKKEGRWCIFNDEKVAVSNEPPLDKGFLYVYQRKH